MQTRKRAKSVTFGKKSKEKTEEKEKDVVQKTAASDTTPEEKVKATEEPQVAEAVSTPEEKSDDVKETSAASEKAAEPEKTEEVDEPVVMTPKDDFLTDSSQEKTDKTEEPDKAEDSSPDIVLSDNLSNVSEGISPDSDKAEDEKKDDSVASLSPEQPIAASASQPTKQELSETPPSAFTLQGEDGGGGSGSGGKKRFGLYFFVVALLSFILGLGAMAAVTYFGLFTINLPKELPFKLDSVSQISLNNAQPTAAPSATPEPTASPTPEPVDRAAYSIVVLNGSGVSGRAATTQSDLTTAGFTVSSVGNADRSDYVNTQISVKQSVSDAYVNELIQELEKTYELDTVSRIPDESSQASDVVVTLGSQTTN